jgi:hypothetical protein
MWRGLGRTAVAASGAAACAAGHFVGHRININVEQRAAVNNSGCCLVQKRLILLLILRLHPLLCLHLFLSWRL